MNDINAKDTYDKMKSSTFIIAELAVLLARLNAAGDLINNMPIVIPTKYSSSIRDISFAISMLRGEMLAEQHEHEERIDDLFGITKHDNEIPF